MKRSIRSMALFALTGVVGCAGQASQPGGDVTSMESTLITEAYAKLSDFTRGSNAPLTVQLERVELRPYAEVANLELSSLMPATAERLVLLKTENDENGSQSVQYEPQWQGSNGATASGPASVTLAAATAADNVFEGAPVDKVALLTVHITGQGHDMTYETIALIAKQGSEAKFQFGDRVLGAANLSLALAESRPNAADVRQATSVRPNNVVTHNWHYRSEDFAEHAGGSHGYDDYYTGTCNYSGGKTYCDFPSLRWGPWETGNTWNLHDYNVSGSRKTSSGAGSQSCEAAIGMGVCSGFFGCNINVNVSWTGGGWTIGVTSSSTVIWQWMNTVTQTC